MTQTRSLISILLCIYVQVIASDYNSVPVDGFNAFNLDTLDYKPSHNFSLTSGSANDSFTVFPEQKPQPADSGERTPRIQFYGLLGAETGDPLLNVYSNPGAYPNRDHATNVYILGHLPRLPLTLAYRYRYIDTYSDRFDSIWSSVPMVNSQEGLSHEHLAMALYNNSKLTMQLLYNWYEKWTATPYYFSPLYTGGFKLAPQLRYESGSVLFYSTWLFNRHSDYYDHVTALEYNDLSGTSGISAPLFTNVKGSVEFIFDYASDPEASIALRLQKLDSTSRVMWGLSATMFSDMHAAVNGFGLLKFTPNVQCSVSIARDHLSKERNYTFLENGTLVRYNSRKADQTNVYGALSYKNTILFPVSAALWTRYCSDPLQEKVSFSEGNTVITLDTSNSSATFFAGFHGTYSLSYRNIHCDLTPTLIYPIGKSLAHFKLPKRGRINLYYQQQNDNPVQAGVTVTYKDESALSYILPDENYTIQNFTAPAQTSVNIHLRVPFPAPFISSVVQRTAFIVDGGPVRLSGTQRVKEHPKGNLIGPAIYAGIEGIIK